MTEVSPEILRVRSEPRDEGRKATSGDVLSTVWELQPESPIQGSATCEKVPGQPLSVPLARKRSTTRRQLPCPCLPGSFPLGFSPPEVLKTAIIKPEQRGKCSARKERGRTTNASSFVSRTYGGDTCHEMHFGL